VKLSDLETPRGKKFLLGVLALLAAFPAISTDAYLPAFGQITEHFGVGIDRIQLTLSISFLGLGIGQLFWGPISDRFGRKKPALIGILVYIAASLTCALAPSVDVLMGARFFQAFGGAAAFLVGRAIVRDLYKGQEMARTLAAVSSIFLIAPILGPSLGAAILNVATWPWIFVAMAALGAIAFISLSRLPESLSPENRTQHGFASSISAYGRIIRDREFVFATMQASVASFIIFTFVASAPDVFMGHFGISEFWFAIIFGANAVGLLGGTQLNRHFLKSKKVQLALRYMVILQVSSATALAIFGGLTGVLWIVLPLLMLTTASGPSIAGNSTTLALHNFKKNAAQAAALLGVIQNLAAASIMAFVAFLPMDALYKMLLVLAGSGLLSLIVLLTRERELKKNPVDLES